MNQKKKILSQQRQAQQLPKQMNDWTNGQDVPIGSCVPNTDFSRNEQQAFPQQNCKIKCLKIPVKNLANNNRITFPSQKVKQIESNKNLEQIATNNSCGGNQNINNHYHNNQNHENKNSKKNVKSHSAESISNYSKIPMPSLITINLIKKTLERAVKNSEEFLHTNSFRKSRLNEVCSRIFKISNKITKSSVLSQVKSQSLDNESQNGIESAASLAISLATANNNHCCAREISNTEGFRELKSISAVSSNQPRSNSLSKSGFVQLKKQQYTSLQHRNKLTKTAKILQPGPGILKRAQQAEMTLTGLAIVRSEINHLLTFEEQKSIRQNPNTVKRLKILMEEPYNEMSNILDHLGLTGLGGIIQEKILQLKYPVKCLINVTYESPLIKLSGWEVYRIPVADDKNENLSIYFDEIADKIEQMKCERQSTIVHCLVGVSRSATMILGCFSISKSIN